METPYHAVGVQSGHETLCVKITKCSQLYLVMVVYHPPKPIYNSHDFLARLTNDVDYLISTYPHAVLILTGEYEVFKLLNSVKKTSPGHDSIPYWVFKHCAMELTPVVTVLFNTILQTGTPPSSWKTALVTPVPKTAGVKTFSDLRPISVTPILSRLVEKLVVRKYIIPALPADLIADQFAYRPTGSTTSALISLIHSVTQKLESCTYDRCLLVDYVKAFDIINHPILFRKILTLSILSTVQESRAAARKPRDAASVLFC